MRWTLVVVVVACGAGQSGASWGDTSHEYRECKEYCLKKNCTAAEDVEAWRQRQPLAESLLGVYVIHSFFGDGLSYANLLLRIKLIRL